jgi:hypothetical protein
MKKGTRLQNWSRCRELKNEGTEGTYDKEGMGRMTGPGSELALVGHGRSVPN